MKSLKTMSAFLAAMIAVLFVAQSAQARPDSFYRSEPRSLRQVQSVWVDSNSCSADISAQLEQRGFLVANRPSSADAVLVVDVDRRISGRSYGMASSADYQAKLRNGSDIVLFTASGTKFGRSYGDLCDGIGDSIARSMSEMG